MSELTPITRKETFLAKVGGQNVVTPTPITREETFLQAIIDNGSGGGGGTGGGVLVCTMDIQTVTLDKTWKEIHDASFAVVVYDTTEGGVSHRTICPVLLVDNSGASYELSAAAGTLSDGTIVLEVMRFSTDSENGYPTINMG